MAKKESSIPSILYKYRAVEPWNYLLDILLNSRLFAAGFGALNDPMEGVFTYSPRKVERQAVNQLLEHKMKLSICSLSEVHNSSLMWSYYAAGHTGVVLGVRVIPTAPGIELRKISYGDSNQFRGPSSKGFPTSAQRILSKKQTAWKHEREIRVFSKTAFVPVELHSVHLGCRMPVPNADLLRAIIKKVAPAVTIDKMTEKQLDSQIRERRS